MATVAVGNVLHTSWKFWTEYGDYIDDYWTITATSSDDNVRTVWNAETGDLAIYADDEAMAVITVSVVGQSEVLSQQFIVMVLEAPEVFWSDIEKEDGEAYTTFETIEGTLGYQGYNASANVSANISLYRLENEAYTLVKSESDVWEFSYSNLTEGSYKIVGTVSGIYTEDLEGNVNNGPFTAEYCFTVTDYVESNGLTYKLAADKTASVTGGDSTATELTVAETIDGYTVTSIAEEAFMGNTTLTTIHLPDTIETICARAFKGCTALANMD